MGIYNYKYIIWDFDGVILNSDAVRELGFVEALKDFPEKQVALLLKYHRSNGGLSRYNKFRYFYEEILGLEVTEEQVNELAHNFSQIMLQKLTDKKLLIQDSVQFIEKNSLDKVMFIASGSDHNELNFLCKELAIAEHFFSINGSPTHKNDIVKRILSEYSDVSKEEFVLVGDSRNDFEAADINGIAFLGYNKISLKTKYNREYITKLSNE